MKPSSVLGRTREQISSQYTKPVRIGLKGGGCPIGTVPIRRITKEDLVRERFASNLTSVADNIPGVHVSNLLIVYIIGLPRIATCFSSSFLLS